MFQGIFTIFILLSMMLYCSTYTVCREVINGNTDIASDWSGIRKLIAIGNNLKVIETLKISLVCSRMKVKDNEILSKVT